MELNICDLFQTMTKIFLQQFYQTNVQVDTMKEASEEDCGRITPLQNACATCGVGHNVDGGGRARYSDL